MRIPEEFESYVTSLNNYITSALSGEKVKVLELSKPAFSGGKRIRGLVSLLSCESVGNDWKKAIPVATAYEFGHEASLIQDDIFDKSEKRRGNPSMHKQYGMETAVLISDALLFKKYEILSASYGGEAFFPKLIKAVSECGKNTAEGEYLDISYSKKSICEVSENDYLDMIKLRTGSLLSAAAKCGGIVGCGTDAQCKTLKEFGEQIGMAFQIKDDIIDCFGKDTGKPMFQDMKNGTKNIFTSYIAEKCDKNESEEFEKLISGKIFDENQTDGLQMLLKETGALDYAEGLSQKFIYKAKKSLNSTTMNYGTEKLMKLTDFLVDRAF